MILWTLNYKENESIPTTYYKIVKFDITEDIEQKLEKEIFRLFYLTHRDAKVKIEEIENKTDNDKCKELYELLFRPKRVKHRIEYLLSLLNLFSIEIEEMGIV